MFEYTLYCEINFTQIYKTERQIIGNLDEMKRELRDGVKEAIEKETGVKFDDFNVDIKLFERDVD